VFLYTHYDQFDNAVDVLMTHSAEAWKHDLFKEVISKVSNTEVYYRAIDFYLEEHPTLLNDLLMDLVQNLDHSRVVTKLKQENHLPLIFKFMLHVQRDNHTVVNEAINSLYIAEENYKGLRESIDSYNSFDQVALAQQLEKHELVEFRRIAAYLYKLNKRFERSLTLSKADRLWADAMECAADSKDQALAEELIRFFVDNKENECFAAALYTCYDLIRPDTVLELAWRMNLMQFAMPFMIQCFREYDSKINAINARLEQADKEKEDKAAAEQKAREELQANMHVSAPVLSLMPPVAVAPVVHPGFGGSLVPMGHGGMGGGSYLPY